MQDRYLVTIEIDTYDGNPKDWDWSALLGKEDTSKVLSSEFKGRALPQGEQG